MEEIAQVYSRSLFEVVDKIIDRVANTFSRELKHHVATLLLHRIERSAKLTKMLGRGQHPKRVAGGRGVDHHHRVGVFLRQLADPHPRHQLIDAG